jgi:hypothetical protein
MTWAPVKLALMGQDPLAALEGVVQDDLLLEAE